MTGQEFYQAYINNQKNVLIPQWQKLIYESDEVLESFFFDIRVAWEENTDGRESKDDFRKRFMRDYYDLVEYQKLEPAKHTRILELNQKVRETFNRGFRGQSQYLSSEQTIINGKLTGATMNIKEKLIATIKDANLTESQEKRIEQLLNQFELERKADARGIISKLRDR